MFASYLLSEARCNQVREELQTCQFTILLLEHYLKFAKNPTDYCPSVLRLLSEKLGELIQRLDPDELRIVQQRELVQKLAAPAPEVPHA